MSRWASRARGQDNCELLVLHGAAYRPQIYPRLSALTLFHPIPGTAGTNLPQGSPAWTTHFCSACNRTVVPSTCWRTASTMERMLNVTFRGGLYGAPCSNTT